MPKTQPSRHSRQPSGPYNLRTIATTNPPATMGDHYLTMTHQSQPHWSPSQFPQYTTQPMMTSQADYSHSLLTPGLPHAALPTPVHPPRPSSRYSHSRQPSQSAPWTAQEDEQLRRARQQGLGWSAIQEQYFPGKSGNACRKRYERVMIKNRGADWDEERLEALAANYDAMRGQIWQPLASVIGEKWETVEKICMAQGLKTLKNKASSHQRNQSSSASSGRRISSEYEHDHSSPHDNFDDSGMHDSAISLGVRRSVRRRNEQQHSSASLGNILHHPQDMAYSGYQ